MPKCPNCDHIWKEAGEAPSERRKVNFKWKDTCFVLSKHPDCETGFKDFLDKVAHAEAVTEKQFKFFKVIHYKCLGTWPNFEDYAGATGKPQPTPSSSSPLVDDSIPF